MKYAGLNYQGTQFASALNVSGKDYLHVDFWTANSTALNIFLISPGPAETPYSLPIVGGQWVSVDIPLTHFSSIVNLADVIQFKVDGNGTIWFDNLYFWEHTAAPTTGCAVDWTSLVQTTILSGGTQLKKTANSPTGWSGGAISQDVLSASADGWLEFEALALDRRMVVGLAAYNTNSLNTSIRYGVELVTPGAAYISENGVRVHSIGEYVVGDIFRVSKEGFTVKYYHNGALVYTSTQTPSCDYYADAAMLSRNGIVKATASFGCGSPRPTVTNDNTTLNFSEAVAYPNPFEDNITVNYAASVEDVKSIEMYNINGQHIRSIAISADGQTIINTSDLQSGVYIISINGTKHLKVVKM
jgi:hypothetical protein